MIEDVRRFHEAVGGRVADGFTPAVLEGRHGFIEEEAREVLDALAEAKNEAHRGAVAEATRRHVIQELIDLAYVIMGAFVELGIDPAPAWKAVQEANMRKAPGENGGKAVKPEGWEPPEIRLVELRR